jgi:ubiquinone/menaquinone biosynthesis C-methylase UbiE
MFNFFKKKDHLRWFNSSSPIIDLGSKDKSLKGIYSTVQDNNLISKFIHEQFTDNAEDYAEKYEAPEHWNNLINNALDKIIMDPRKILDIGSGSGNTVLPLLTKYPKAKIVACDLSISLLKRLKKRVRQDDNLFILQHNVEESCFKELTLDLVVGGSVLHHLFDPRLSLSM